EDAHGLQNGKTRPQLADHLHVVEALEARRTDEGAALREAQDVVHLAAAEVGPDLVRDRTQPLQGEEDVGELHPVRQLDRDDVSRADAERLESCRHAVDPRLELAVGDAASAIDDRDPIGMRRGPSGQDRVEGLGAPVPRCLIARDQLVGQPGLDLHRDVSTSVLIIRRFHPPRYAALTCGLSRSAAAGPLSTMRPVSITYARAATASAIRAFCSTSKTATFRSRLIDSTIVRISRTTSGARPNDGSSSTSRVGLDISARPIVSICCSPPLSVPASWRRRSPRRGNRSRTSASVRSIAWPSRRRYAPIRRFSRTVICGKSRRPSGACERPRVTMRCARHLEMSTPRKTIRPPLGRTSPESARRVEVLPAPLGPMIATISPSCTVTDTPSTAATLP